MVIFHSFLYVYQRVFPCFQTQTTNRRFECAPLRRVQGFAHSVVIFPGVKNQPMEMSNGAELNLDGLSWKNPKKTWTFMSNALI